MSIIQQEQVVNDGSECYVDATFLDKNGNPYTPSSLQYRVDDISNDISVLGWTTFPNALTTSVSIQIPASINNMNAVSATRERRQVLLNVGIPNGTNRYDNITYVLVRRTGTP